VDHPYSCDASVAYLLSRGAGQGDALEDWLFQHQQELTPDSIRQAAADVGHVTAYQAGYGAAIAEISKDASVGTSIGVSGTPSFFINGRRLPLGGVEPQYFQELI